MNEIRLFEWELASMSEYSCSIPSGTVLWKMWSRNNTAYGPKGAAPEWLVGQYIPCKKNDRVGIRWFKVVFRSGPKPRQYTAPDWDNYHRL